MSKKSSNKPTRIETTRDATSRIAMEIIDSEVAAVQAKTERLRAARLAREAAVTADKAAKLARKA